MNTTPKHFKLYQDAQNQWRWTLFAQNNKKIADSGEGYRNKADCLNGIRLVKAAAAETDVWNAETGEWE